MTDPDPKFGRYVVLDELTGRDGERTLVAYDPQLDRKVGLKVFPPASDGAQARRRDRARVLAGIVHPHVVRVHDVGTYEGRLFAAMDFVEGQTVGPWLEHERPGWQRIVEVFLAAGEGLAAAHAVNLVHGHFSEHSIVVGEDGQIRVLDFVRSIPQLGPAPDEADDLNAWCRALASALRGSNADLLSTPTLPRRVRRAIEEGLREPSRHGSMRTILDELSRGLHRGRRLAVAALLLAAVAGPAIAWTRPEPPPTVKPWCEGIETRMDAAWNDEIAAQGRSAFLATELGYAQESWTATASAIEGFVSEWRDAGGAHCEVKSDELSSQRGAATTVCLHRQFQALQTLVTTLETADAELVTRASQAVASLGSPAVCLVGLEEGARYEGVDLEQVLALESELSRAAVLRDLGRYRDGIATATKARATAEGLGLRPLVAEAEYQIAIARANLGQEAEAERGYHEAFSAAVASGNQEIVARSTMELAVLLAEQGRHDDAARWLQHAAAGVERQNTLPLRTRLAAVRGLAAYRHGYHEEAKEHYERSIALAEEAEPPDGFAKMHATQALSNVLGRLGSYEAQIEHLREGLAFAETSLGARHPSVGHHLNSLAGALAHRGSVDLALETQRRTLEIFEDAFGSDHANTIAARTTQASILHEAGRDDEAGEAYALVLAAAERTFDEDDPRYVNALGNVGMFYALMNRFEQAAELLARAAARNEAIHGPDHVHTLGFLTNVAATHMFAGQLAEAREVYTEILLRTERSLGGDHPQMVPVLLGLAKVEAELDLPADAVPRLEQALEISIARKVRAERIGMVRFNLARALWDAELDRKRALAMARAAGQSFLVAQDSGWEMGDNVVEVEAWIAERTP